MLGCEDLQHPSTTWLDSTMAGLGHLGPPSKEIWANRSQNMWRGKNMQKPHVHPTWGDSSYMGSSRSWPTIELCIAMQSIAERLVRASACRIMFWNVLDVGGSACGELFRLESNPSTWHLGLDSNNSCFGMFWMTLGWRFRIWGSHHNQWCPHWSKSAECYQHGSGSMSGQKNVSQKVQQMMLRRWKPAKASGAWT